MMIGVMLLVAQAASFLVPSGVRRFSVPRDAAVRALPVHMEAFSFDPFDREVRSRGPSPSKRTTPALTVASALDALAGVQDSDGRTVRGSRARRRRCARACARRHMSTATHMHKSPSAVLMTIAPASRLGVQPLGPST